MLPVPSKLLQVVAAVLRAGRRLWPAPLACCRTVLAQRPISLSPNPKKVGAPDQVLYQYPPDVAITPDAAHFCFPHGVQPALLERTPSMSALNELVYSQQYQQSDAASFIFVLKARAHASPAAWPRAVEGPPRPGCGRKVLTCCSPLRHA